MTAPSALDVLTYLPLGAVLGALYFYAVYQTIRLYTAQGAMSKIVGLFVLRGALAAGAFWLVVQQGALPLLLTLAGFVLSRFAVQRWLGRA